MHDDHATDDDGATHYHFINGNVLDDVLSTAFPTTFSTTLPRRRSLDWFSMTLPRRRSLDWLSMTFPRRRSLNVLDDDSDILNHNNRVHVHPAVNDGLTAKDAIEIGMTGVEVCGSCQ
jgi:hypothetical protein